MLALLFSLATLLVLVYDQLTKALPVFAERGVDFLTSGLSSNPAKAGVLQGVIGTAILAVLVTLLAFPLGVATAVYLEEYAPDNRFTRLIVLNIRNLAGVPSVVYGLLGLSVFVAVLSSALGVGNGRNLISGGAHPDGARPADRDHHHERGPPGRPRDDPRGRLRDRGLALAGRAQAARCRPRRPGS